MKKMWEYQQVMNRKTTCDNCNKIINQGSYAYSFYIYPYTILCRDCYKIVMNDIKKEARYER